jgi:8-oxo-dGTP pyrophosphatase MutT (NUDIX family)
MTKETIDFFDEKENFILTANKETKYKENKELYIRGVYIFIVNDKKEILIQRKKEDHGKFNRWEIPSGHVKSKESFEEAAKRELREETGISVYLKKIKIMKFEGQKEFDAFYIGSSNLLPDLKNNSEVDAFEFISLKNLLKEIRGNGSSRLFAPQLIKFLEYCEKDLNIFINKSKI